MQMKNNVSQISIFQIVSISIYVQIIRSFMYRNQTDVSLIIFVINLIFHKWRRNTNLLEYIPHNLISNYIEIAFHFFSILNKAENKI